MAWVRWATLIVGACFWYGPASGAARVDVTVFENVQEADVTALDVWIDVIDVTDAAHFVFHNDSTITQ